MGFGRRLRGRCLGRLCGLDLAFRGLARLGMGLARLGEGLGATVRLGAPRSGRDGVGLASVALVR